MAEAVSGCSADTTGTSLVEVTVVLALVYRPNDSAVPDTPELKTWSQRQDYISNKVIERVLEFIQAGGFEHIDSPIIVEDMTGAHRELRLHVDTKRCEHGDY